MGDQVLRAGYRLNFIWDLSLAKIYANSLMSTLNARATLNGALNTRVKPQTPFAFVPHLTSPLSCSHTGAQLLVGRRDRHVSLSLTWQHVLHRTWKPTRDTIPYLFATSPNIRARGEQIVRIITLLTTPRISLYRGD
jgi:hypothetical protein